MKLLIQTTVFIWTAALVLVAPAREEDDIPLLRPEEREAVEAQSERFNQLLGPALQEAAKSTVRVWLGSNRLAYGTVVGDGSKVLTKWSEIIRSPGALVVESGDGKTSAAKIGSVYAEEDLALLELEGVKFQAVKWSDELPKLGSFLAATQPDGRLAGFGVLSVQERKLRDVDQAFLGVVSQLGPNGNGVEVAEVSKHSGAEAAGIKPGDVIVKIGERKISGLMELRTALMPMEPGDKIDLWFRRGAKEKKVEVLLGNRPKQSAQMEQRLAHMERMGTEVNAVRDSFSRAIQTDMRIDPNEVGGPVVDLNGKVIGITMARADRTRSFVMSSAAVRALLNGSGKDPILAKTEMQEQMDQERAEAIRSMKEKQPSARPQITQQRLQSHIEEMRGVMEFLQNEMDALEKNGGN